MRKSVEQGLEDEDRIQEDREDEINDRSLSITDTAQPNDPDKKKVKIPRILHWDIPHVLIILGVALSYVYQYYHNEFDIFLRLVALTGTVGLITAIVWKFCARFTVEAFKSVFDLLHGKHDSLCRVRSPQSETGSLLDHLFMAVEWSVFPTLVVFFVLSFIAQGIAEEGKSVVENNLIFLFMFFIPPLATFVFIPIRLLTDSSLMRYDIRKRTMEPFGLNFKRKFRAVGGVGALASFAKVALNKGGVENAVWDTFTILLYIFPTIFIATVLYGAWHPGYLRKVEDKIEKLHYQIYRFERNAMGIIVLETVQKEKNPQPVATGSIDSGGSNEDDVQDSEPSIDNIEPNNSETDTDSWAVPMKTSSHPLPDAHGVKPGPETERREARFEEEDDGEEDEGPEESTEREGQEDDNEYGEDQDDEEDYNEDQDDEEDYDGDQDDEEDYNEDQDDEEDYDGDQDDEEEYDEDEEDLNEEGKDYRGSG